MHFGSRWAFYFDGINLAHFKGRPWVFFCTPVPLIALSIRLTALGYFAFLTVITYWFSGFRVMKQNTGFASLYRGRIGLSDPADRKIDNAAIMSASLFLLFARYLRFSDFGVESIFQTALGHALLGAAGLGVAGVLLAWIRVAVLRWRRLGAESLPLLLFTSASIVMFVPFVLAENLTTAFMANLLGRYVQYLGLVWMVHRRKYRPDTVSEYGLRFLQMLSQNRLFLAHLAEGRACGQQRVGLAKLDNDLFRRMPFAFHEQPPCLRCRQKRLSLQLDQVSGSRSRRPRIV